jgi:hypothetical protein
MHSLWYQTDGVTYLMDSISVMGCSPPSIFLMGPRNFARNQIAAALPPLQGERSLPASWASKPSLFLQRIATRALKCPFADRRV